MTAQSAHEQVRPAPAAGEAPPRASPSYTFAQLAQGSQQVHVEHEGQIYRLRLTKNGKLVLNK